MLPGVDTPSPYSQRWDPRKDWTPAELSDCGHVGEDAGGLWLRRHPLVVAGEHPELWGIMAEFESGAREVSSDDVLRLSSFEIEGKLTMMSAANRQELREAKEDDDG